MIILIILIIVLLLSFNLFRNLFKNDTTILDDVKLKEEEPNNNGFALMLQKEDGTYEESTSSTWPTDMVFNSEKSGCVDVNNNIIENALEYDSTNNIMNVSVSGTAYCYVYFDIKRYCNKNEPLGECLLRRNNEIDSLNDNIEGGLYRYQGTNEVVTNNYVCFGTTDKNTCVNNTDTYMYRIIGINENNQIKLIKETSLGNIAWNESCSSNIYWPNSSLFAYLNGNDYLLNETYIPTEWENKITNTSWKHGMIDDDADATTMYELENSLTDITSAKIGLMYMHDYYYAYQSGGLKCSILGDYSNCKNAWIFLGSFEWFMQLSNSLENGCFYALLISSSGYVGSNYLTYSSAVRPVFFVENNVEYLMGTGTIDNPFIIKE